jgi:hypothetical protein
MEFGEALRAIKAGQRVCRSGWNGRGMWLVLVEPDDDEQPPPGVAYSVTGIATRRVPSVRGLPWIGMKTADDGFVPWLASQTDLLASDWEVVS